jgi:hypothetical protein
MADHLYYVKVNYKFFTFKVLIDCGAQISIISPSMALYLGLKSDNRKQGIVKGVGQASILGAIPNCNMFIYSKPLIPVTINLCVIQSQVDKNLIIFGLDFLEKYKCILNCNLKNMVIGNKIVKFMNNKELILYKLPIDKRKIKK